MALLSMASSVGAVSDPTQQKINPPLHDVASDKKFFGPPFPADYPDDKRPAVDHRILNKLKGPEQPYPALQSKEDYDKDYVKDENSDTGAWQAQFEYDRLRKKLAQEEADARRAQDRANREGSDVDGAQRDANAAGKNVDDARNGVDSASKQEKDAQADVKTADDFDGAASKKKLEEIRKAVEAAEDRYEKAKKQFEECKRQLEEAKAQLDDLKKQQAEMEAKLAADTKLWAEQNTMKLNMRKSVQEKTSQDKVAKVKAAQEKLAKAEKVKADMDKVLVKQKAEHEKAKEDLQKEKADYERVQKKVQEASDRLQKIHGYKPAAQVVPTSTKSGAETTSMLLLLPILMLSHFL